VCQALPLQTYKGKAFFITEFVLAGHSVLFHIFYWSLTGGTRAPALGGG